MLGELAIFGTIRAPMGREIATAFWPDMLLRVNHDPRLYPIGTVTSLVYGPVGELTVTSKIVVGKNSLLTLMACPSLGFAGVERSGQLEVSEISVLQHPANAPEEKNPWTVLSGRLPRVIMPWFRVDQWPGAQRIEQFEVGWSFHGDLCEVEPQYAIDDSTALRELAWR